MLVSVGFFAFLAFTSCSAAELIEQEFSCSVPHQQRSDCGYLVIKFLLFLSL
jgi:hypothetical protein